MNHLVELSGIRKSFGGVHALRAWILRCAPARCMRCSGENGAGKSTLMRVLGGEYVPEAGSVSVRGTKEQFRSPVDALDKGIAIIHQEMALATDLTVAENIFLAELPAAISLARAAPPGEDTDRQPRLRHFSLPSSAIFPLPISSGGDRQGAVAQCRRHGLRRADRRAVHAGCGAPARHHPHAEGAWASASSISRTASTRCSASRIESR